VVARAFPTLVLARGLLYRCLVSDIATVQDVSDGALLDGKYRIRRVIGQGGMGVVVEAVHVELDDRVAIKFLTPKAMGDSDVVSRFVREARAVVRLRSQHIVRVRDVGNLPGGDPFIVMDFLEGVELRELYAGPRLAPGAIVDLLLQACEGLAEAHAHGIVHRDIKPANLFVTKQFDGMPLVKVLDFGVSKASDNLHLTGTSSWMGTPSYMSPEQMRSSRQADARSDIWSMGVVLYEGLEGRVPFPADNLAELCVQVTSEPALAMTSDVDPALAAVVMTCLEKDPARRYGDIAAFAQALAPHAHAKLDAQRFVERTRRLLSGRSVDDLTAAKDRHRAAEPVRDTIADLRNETVSASGHSRWFAAEPVEGDPEPAPRRRRLAIAAGGALAVAAILVGIVASSRGNDSSASERPDDVPASRPTARETPAEAPSITELPAPAAPPSIAPSPTRPIVEPPSSGARVPVNATVPRPVRRKSAPTIDAPARSTPGPDAGAAPTGSDPLQRRI
jgi:serine/threonine-protein kinase